VCSALGGGGWSASRSGRALPPGKGPPVSLVQEVGWATQSVGLDSIPRFVLRVCLKHSPLLGFMFKPSVVHAGIPCCVEKSSGHLGVLKQAADYSICSKQAVLWLRRLVAGFLPRRPGFAIRSVSVGFVVDKVVPGQVSLPVLRFSLPISVHGGSPHTRIIWGMNSRSAGGSSSVT
jgi:hypothetical protein